MVWEQLDEYEILREYYDEYQESAKQVIVRLIRELNLVTDREIKVRLEADFFPWVVSGALNSLESEGLIEAVGYPGRPPGPFTPKKFYKHPDFDYHQNLESFREKRNLTTRINEGLTGEHIFGTHAENVFERAFTSLGFGIIGRNVSQFRGRNVLNYRGVNVRVVNGRQPPDIDFLLEMNGLFYGADIKNWLRYERNSISEIISKVEIAFHLHLIPIICARYVDKDTIYNELKIKGVKYYIYKELLIPESYETLGIEASNLLGYPILSCESLPSEKLNFMAEKVFNL